MFVGRLDLANGMLQQGMKGVAPSPEEMAEPAPMADSEMGPGEPGGDQQLVDLIASIVMEILGGGAQGATSPMPAPGAPVQ